ncbi:quinone oxidoreductase-like protein 2 [Numida meleagris]|uniref:quinone oxidoreductase-like protein 2 n=1 Tax=Numida meleagris TaxID=8996 RepID=UPI000B3DCEDD|nr:quinone oxidoreductase-like protein 2 [Numida meleagris]
MAAAAAAARRLCALGLPALPGARGYRAAVCTQLAQPLLVQDLPAPPLQPRQVRVRVHYCGLNFADILACKGLYQDKHAPPFTPGMEFSGTVTETGENVSAVKEGHRVIGVTDTSAMAEECIVDEKMLWQIPNSVSSEDAAVLPVTYGTAWLALHHRARLQPRETVLVTAGAGASGLAIIDLAVSVFQAKVIAAAGSDPKCQLVLASGASHTVNYSQDSLREQVTALTGGRGVDVAIEAVGGDVFKAVLQSLAWEGRIVVMGFAGGKIPSIPANLLLLKNVSAMGVYWSRYQREDFPLFSSAMSSLLQYCQEGKIHPHVGAVFKLEEVNEAFSHVLQRKSTGKVIISMK